MPAKNIHVVPSADGWTSRLKVVRVVMYTRHKKPRLRPVPCARSAIRSS